MNNIYPKKNYDFTNEEIVYFQTIIQNNDNLIKSFLVIKIKLKISYILPKPRFYQGN